MRFAHNNVSLRDSRACPGQRRHDARCTSTVSMHLPSQRKDDNRDVNDYHDAFDTQLVESSLLIGKWVNCPESAAGPTCQGGPTTHT